MEIPVTPAGTEPVAAPVEPADVPQQPPMLALVPGGGDVTATRATLHAVPSA